MATSVSSAAAPPAAVPRPRPCADRCGDEGAILYSTVLKRQNRVSRAATAGLDESYGQFLEALNAEARAAIESERLLAHLMAWRDAPTDGSADASRVIAPSGRYDPPRAAPARRDTPRLGEVSPVQETARQHLVRIIERARPPTQTGRIDVFG